MGSFATGVPSPLQPLCSLPPRPACNMADLVYLASSFVTGTGSQNSLPVSMAAAGTLKLDDLSGGDSDSELDLTAPARVLCIISSGGFLRSNVNVALVKAAIASKVGIQGGGGGVDFSDVSLPLVNSAETRDGWVMRAIGGRGPALLGAWAGSGPHSTSVEITPSDGGASGPVRIVVDSVHLSRAMCAAIGGPGSSAPRPSPLLCARRFGLGRLQRAVAQGAGGRGVGARARHRGGGSSAWRGCCLAPGLSRCARCSRTRSPSPRAA